MRTRLILVFLAATLAPLGVTVWLAVSLLEHSLRQASTRELDEISKVLEKIGREFYRQARESLKKDAEAGLLQGERYRAASREDWPEAVAEFWEGGEEERFLTSGTRGDRLLYLTRRGQEVLVYARPLGGVEMQQVSGHYTRARALIEESGSRDLRRGFVYTFLLLAGAVWLTALAALIFLAHRLSRPIQQLTAGLARVGAGDLSARVTVKRKDEIGRAVQAFNRMAGQLQQSRERLLYLTRLESWQSLARKMAHELKNSLTPIRLTMEEVAARASPSDREFLKQAAQIVVEEVHGLERRVRAFSDFAAEPPVRPRALDANALLAERIAFLEKAHPEIDYRLALENGLPPVWADEDLVKGVLTNLLENAAVAAGAGGLVLCRTQRCEGMACLEVHDSGPGLSPEARSTLFEPTISFKKGGMGLGLSIARKSALLCGGDILLVKGELGGAAFRVLLPLACSPEG